MWRLLQKSGCTRDDDHRKAYAEIWFVFKEIVVLRFSYKLSCSNSHLVARVMANV